MTTAKELAENYEYMTNLVLTGGTNITIWHRIIFPLFNLGWVQGLLLRMGKMRKLQWVWNQESNWLIFNYLSVFWPFCSYKSPGTKEFHFNISVEIISNGDSLSVCEILFLTSLPTLSWPHSFPMTISIFWVVNSMNSVFSSPLKYHFH